MSSITITRAGNGYIATIEITSEIVDHPFPWAMKGTEYQQFVFSNVEDLAVFLCHYFEQEGKCAEVVEVAKCERE